MATLKLKGRTLLLIILSVVAVITGVFLYKKYALISGRAISPTASQGQFIRDEESALVNEYTKSIKRCGQIPDDETLKIVRENYRRISLSVWSPACKYIAWSVWQSGPEGVEYEGPYPHEGVFLYEQSSAGIQRVYAPEKQGETPEFLGWVNDRSLKFSIYTNSNRKVLIYELTSKTINPD